MPRKNPAKISYTLIRNYAEKFEWHTADGRMQRGYNPPHEAEGKTRVPFLIKYITREGKVEEGEVTCISVNAAKHQRSIKFVKSNEIRVVRDYLIMEIDGITFLTH